MDRDATTQRLSFTPTTMEQLASRSKHFTTSNSLDQVDTCYARRLGPSFRRERDVSQHPIHGVTVDSDTDIAFVDDHGDGARVVASPGNPTAWISCCFALARKKHSDPLNTLAQREFLRRVCPQKVALNFSWIRPSVEKRRAGWLGGVDAGVPALTTDLRPFGSGAWQPAEASVPSPSQNPACPSGVAPSLPAATSGAAHRGMGHLCCRRGVW